jgi:hypothetical protein
VSKRIKIFSPLVKTGKIKSSCGSNQDFWFNA